MPFIIVKTIEDNLPYITACPDTWEDRGTLYWPRECLNIEKLRSNEKMKPQKSWMRLNCEVKKRNIATYGEAIKYEIALSNVETDSEQEVLQDRKGRQHTKVYPVSSQGIHQNSQDFNYLLTIPEERHDKHSPERQNRYQMMIASTASDLGPAVTPTQIAREDPVQVCAEGIDEAISVQELPRLQCENCLVLSNEINNMKAKYDLLSLLPGINVKLDRILEQQERNDCTTTATMRKKGASKINIFPIASIEVFDDFETKLSDESYREQFIYQMSSIGGTSGNRDGIKIAYRLVDEIFTRELLKYYSWTGTKTKYEKKQFSAYNRFLQAFYDIVKLADDKYSTTENEKFFKEKILKHSLARSKQKNK
ncbi:uncharacterized protein LOC129800067 [Phlebotomus papatasi]|uniref:uncharacterized protein LOC129800067 n=1 Tax=Phlebotomus papatasi TaxID=29031 RepID=UPI00248448B1|nr:uncharacterized protein LOC129800067 [Phlebotomus papatasi]